MSTQTPREKYLKRYSALKTERASWLDHWRDISDHFCPRRSRFLSSDRNKGTKRNSTIINNTPSWALRICASGMMAGITSPARPWFRLTTPELDLDQFGPVRAWLHAVEERMRMAFARSNLYTALHSQYFNLAAFGTSPMIVEEDDQDILRAYVLPVGQYALANSDRQAVDTVYRELGMTVGQLVSKFGIDAVSATVKLQYEQQNVDQWVDVLHIIEPNRNYKTGKAGPQGQKFKSCWMELAGDATTGFLRESGYEQSPLMSPRWDVTGEDVYGHSPGMEALGDSKALQLLEKRAAQAADKIVNPPMRAPMALMNGRASLLPGDVTYLDTIAGGQTFEPAVMINPAAIQIFGAKIQEHEQRVKAAMYADLWLMMADSDRRQITAREIAERHEEKMLQLGPVLERLQDELLDPLIDRAFDVLDRSGQLPPPPPELQGRELKVEYISILAQAQKLLGITSTERLASFVGNLAAVKPEVLDKLNFDELVDDYADSLGVNPALVVPDEQVAQVRAARAQQQQAAQAAEAASVAAQGAKTLSETDMSGDSALSRLTSAMGVAA